MRTAKAKSPPKPTPGSALSPKAEVLALWSEFVRTRPVAEVDAMKAKIEAMFPRKSASDAQAEPKPGSSESLRRETEKLENATALLQISQAVEREISRETEKHLRFGRACARWLHARAALEDPDADGSEEAGAALFSAVDEATRTLLITPAISDEELWQKWEVLDDYVSEDAIQGQALDNRAIMALGCVKADLLRLGIGRGQ